MRYYKILSDDRPTVIGVGEGGIEITEAEYNSLKNIIDNRPAAPTGYGYRLTAELEWELYELPLVENDEVSDEEVLAELMEVLA